MKKQHITLCVLLAAMLTVAAVQVYVHTRPEPVEPVADGVYVDTAETEDYRLTLPEGVTARDGANDSLILFRGGEEVGGVVAIPFAGADALDIRKLTADPQDQDTWEGFDRLYETMVPQGQIDHQWTSSLYGSFCLNLVDGERSTLHYFFPDGDQFFDLYFGELTLGVGQEDGLLEGFCLI